MKKKKNEKHARLGVIYNINNSILKLRQKIIVSPNVNLSQSDFIAFFFYSYTFKNNIIYNVHF